MGKWNSAAPRIIFRKKCVALIYMVVIGALLILVINRFNINSLAIKLKTTTSNNKSTGIPRCDLSRGGGWLDRNNFVYKNSAVNQSMVIPKEATNCHLHSYTKRDAIICLDSIETISSEIFTKRFVFIGDSRGRQQFFNFLRFEPQWDNAIEADVDLHIDRNVTSHLLGLHVSYLWHPRLDGEWIKIIKEWLKHPPHLILISMGFHHLMGGYDYKLELLQKRLINFLPSLRSLANKTELIWMNQYPMIRDSAITSWNIQKLNEFVRPLLQYKHCLNSFDLHIKRARLS